MHDTKYDIIVAGAGISGATLAERFATVCHKKVLVIEKRDHIGGNCYDYVDEAGVLVSKYGAHIFHTNYEDVWEYVGKFTDWFPYVHKVVSVVDGKIVPVPVNITTVNLLFGLSIQSEEEMKLWLQKQIVPMQSPQNSEESALSRVGPALYEKMFKLYTQKQWDVSPKELDASVLDRIPVRTNFDDRYFTDEHQGMPKEGYTKLFEKMLNHPNITLKLNTDYFTLQKELPKEAPLFFTGPIDGFFGYKFGEKLQYRSIRFVFESFTREFYQDHAVINYPNDHEYTRIVEYKHLTGQNCANTTISKEYPTWDGEPYYPVPSKRNREVYDAYQKEALTIEAKHTYFVGRLANYKYFNMDQAFKNALDLFTRVKPFFTV
jgi:UDP-galactopyranose mutase